MVGISGRMLVMALGRRKPQQQALFVNTVDLTATLKPHPYYAALNKVLAAHQFDAFVESVCASFYKGNVGRPGLAPGVYFRCLLIGYLEGLDSERGIAWRAADSFSLKQFLGIALDQPTPDHSTLSRTRRLIDLETHAEVFTLVLKILANHNLLGGKSVGIDSTTLEANAAMRSIVRRDTGEGYGEFLRRLAKESGIATPTREALAKLDKARKRKGSNDDWQNPHDPDAKIAKMKDGRTHLAHKAEHAVDLGEDTHGAILAVNVADAAAGDTKTMQQTLSYAANHLQKVAEDERVATQVDADWLTETVADKGYHARQLLAECADTGLRTYISEPKRGRQKWKDDTAARTAVHGNRRRIEGDRGKRLLRRRGEFLERSFAHAYESGAMRRLHLRGRENIAKRVLIHAAGFNLGLLMRVSYGFKKPRGLGRGVLTSILPSWHFLMASIDSLLPQRPSIWPTSFFIQSRWMETGERNCRSATGC
jgi:transposase